jgi:hypothetical protein
MWPLVIIGAIVVGAIIAGDKKKVFISYDHSEDVHLRNLLEAWNKNSRFSFTMERTSPFQRIESDDEAVVKRALTPMLKKADYLLVIVGEKTAKSRFVCWEIERAQAKDVNLRIAAVKQHPRCRLPAPLLGKNVSCAKTFSHAAVTDALENARPTH